MAISPKCNACGNELMEKGAVLLSPPDPKILDRDVVSKFHLCSSCWDKFILMILKRVFPEVF